MRRSKNRTLGRLSIYPHYQSCFVRTGLLWLSRKNYFDKILKELITQYQSHFISQGE